MTRLAGAAPRAVPADERDLITRDAFIVSPELLGLPLARPWRRGVALAIDGLLIAVLSGGPGLLFGFAAAILLFRVSGRPAPGGYIRRSVRLFVRVLAALILFGLSVALWGTVASRFGPDDDAADEAEGSVSIGGIEGLRVGGAILRLQGASTEAEARAVADSLVPSLQEAGLSDDDIREVFVDMSDLPGRAWMAAVADSVLGVETVDTATARDTVAILQAELLEAESRAARLEDRVDELEEESERGVGIMAMLRGLADDLGLGVGWAAIYFTAFLTLWKGRTPGKRVMRIRVIRLDGQQLGWWASFGRFGGYAAGVATGLLGFAQIFWDRNRQAVHDKISETVVIREAKP